MGDPHSLTKSKRMLEEEAASLWDQDKLPAFAIFKADKKKCYLDTHPDRCTQQAASNSLVSPRLSWDAQQPSLFSYGPTASGLYKKRSSLPITRTRTEIIYIANGRRRGRGRRKGNRNLKSKGSWWKTGFRRCHSNKKLSCFGSDFPLPQNCILVWVGYWLQSPCCEHLTSQLHLPHKTTEWARGSKEVYYSLQVRAVSSALWALRGTVKSGAGFLSHRAAAVVSEYQLHRRKPFARVTSGWSLGSPSRRFSSCPPTELFCGSARTRGDTVADTVWGRELGSNTEDAIKGRREDKMHFFS